MSEDPQPGAIPETPAGQDVTSPAAGQDVTSPAAGQDVTVPARSRVGGIVAGHLSDQARQTAQALRAGRVANSDGEPGVRDLTPLRDLLAELVEELQRMRPRERIARALRQAADAIDPPPVP